MSRVGHARRLAVRAAWLALALGLVAPRPAVAQVTTCNATVGPAGSEQGGLNTCRNARRDQPWLGEASSLFYPANTMVVDRYEYAMCKNGQPCSRYKCECLPGQLCRVVEDTACVWKVSRDRQLEAQHACYRQNRVVRKQAEDCRDDLAGQPWVAGTPVLRDGLKVDILKAKTPQVVDVDEPVPPPAAPPNPCADPYTEFDRAQDIGLGQWEARSVPRSASSYTTYTDYPPNDPVHRAVFTQQMTWRTPARPNWLASWTETFNTEKPWIVRVFSLQPSDFTGGDLQATACYQTGASLFAQGFANPAGTGATATPANIDLTTSYGNPTGPISQFLTDLVTAQNALWSNKLQSQCDDTLTAWNRHCSTLPEGTTAHSLGAISTRAWGIPVSRTIGSVDNLPAGAPSYQNNCDLVPRVTQLGLWLLSQLPTPADNVFACSSPTATDCLDITATPPVWRGGPINPRSAGCATGGTCWVKWCAGRPGSPSQALFSGRSTFPDAPVTLAGGVFDSRMCRKTTAVLDRFDRCLRDSLGQGGVAWFNCVTAYLTSGPLAGAVDDHLLGGAASVKFNGYQVLAGLENLGRRQRPVTFGLFRQNAPPPLTTLPTGGLQAVCEIIEP